MAAQRMLARNHQQQLFAKQFAAYDIRFRHRQADHCQINLSRLQSLYQLRRGFFPELRIDAREAAEEITNLAEALAGRGQADGSAEAIEKRRPKIFFQALDLLR